MATLKPTFTGALLSRTPFVRTTFSKAMLVGALILFSNASVSNAQIGSRLGGLFQFGNGQSARIGGTRSGMQYGGVPRTSVGGQNYAVRYGNGQVVRLVGQNYGRQYSGMQGTQLVRTNVRPNTTIGRVPATYYYGNVRSRYQPAVPVARSISRQPNYQLTARPVMRPVVVVRPNVIGVTAASPVAVSRPSNVGLTATRPMNSQPLTNRYRSPTGSSYPIVNNLTLDSQVRPAAAVSVLQSQYDAVRQVTVPSAAAEPTAPKVNLDGSVSLRFPSHDDAPFAYQLNGDQYSIGKNQTVTLATSDEYKVRFSGGAGIGDRIATLEAGKSYVFDLRKKEGWVLIPDLQSLPVSTADPQNLSTLKGSSTAEESLDAEVVADPEGAIESEVTVAPEDIIVPAKEFPDVDPGKIPASNLTDVIDETDDESAALDPFGESKSDFEEVESSILELED